jgi:hypothetical protein
MSQATGGASRLGKRSCRSAWCHEAHRYRGNPDVAWAGPDVSPAWDLTGLPLKGVSGCFNRGEVESYGLLPSHSGDVLSVRDVRPPYWGPGGPRLPVRRGVR